MEEFQCSKAIAERQIHPPGVRRVDQPGFIAFHCKSDGGSKGYGVQSISIAVEIHFGDRKGIKNSEIGSAAGDGFVLRSIHKDLLSLKRSGHWDKILNAVGTCHGAAHPAAVKPLMENVPVGIGTDISGLWMPAVSEIVCGEQVKIVHDGHQVRGSDS